MYKNVCVRVHINVYRGNTTLFIKFNYLPFVFQEDKVFELRTQFKKVKVRIEF